MFIVFVYFCALLCLFVFLFFVTDGAGIPLPQPPTISAAAKRSQADNFNNF